MLTDQINQSPASQVHGERIRNHIHKVYTSIATNVHIALRYSLYLTACFVGIFILARLAGFSKFTEFRFINYILFFPIGYAAVKRAYHLNGNYIQYFTGLMIGFLTVIAAQLWYAILFVIYLSFDQPFLDYLLARMPKPLYYPEASVFFVLMVEGLGAGSILALTLMQYFKWKRGWWGFKH